MDGFLSEGCIFKSISCLYIFKKQVRDRNKIRGRRTDPGEPFQFV